MGLAIFIIFVCVLLIWSRQKQIRKNIEDIQCKVDDIYEALNIEKRLDDDVDEDSGQSKIIRAYIPKKRTR